MRGRVTAFDAGGMAYYSPQPQQYVYVPVVVAPPPASGVATASLVLGIVGVFGGWCLFGLPCIAAVVLGHMGLAATRDGQRSGRGQATAGLILGYLFVLPMIVFTVLVIGGIVADAGDPAPSLPTGVGGTSSPDAGFGVGG